MINLGILYLFNPDTRIFQGSYFNAMAAVTLGATSIYDVVLPVYVCPL